jgi:hypothetical protein
MIYTRGVQQANATEKRREEKKEKRKIKRKKRKGAATPTPRALCR